MIKTTQWSVDTCDCVIVFSWDSEKPESLREHTPISVSKRCSYHKNHSVQDCYLGASKESAMMHGIIDRLARRFPEYTKIDDGGNVVIDRSKVEYSFDDLSAVHRVERKIKVWCKGADLEKTKKREVIKTFLSGKVSFDFDLEVY